MDRGSKRKAAASAPSSPEETRSTKRIKLPAPNSSNADSQSAHPTTGETPQGTTQTGLHFVENLRKAADKSGRRIATPFLTLPDPDDLPDYYEVTALPIAIDTLETKLKAGEYPHLSALESDVKRMVSNAKQYNESKSDIYADAERVRKMTFNYMSKANPAYKHSGYQNGPTPLPAESTPKPKIRLKAPSTKRSASAALDSNGATPTPAPDAKRAKTLKNTNGAAKKVDQKAEESPGPFKGKTFQDVQDQIIMDMINYKDDTSGLEIFAPFVNLPPRALHDYYAVIKQPTSLKGVQKRVHGVHGRNEVTGTTDFKSWDSFENEVSKIWNNAREYNEDGSEMFLLAGEFQEAFNARLNEAKKHVEEPPQPTIKLNMSKPQPAPMKIRLDTSKGSPAANMPKSNSPAVRPGTGSSSIAIDQQSLERQKAHVQAGVNGHAHPTAQRPTSRPGSSSQPAAAAVKPENANKSPALNAARVAPPLANPSRLSNGVHVNGTVMPTTNGVALAVNGHPSVMPPPGAAYPSAAQHTPHPGMNSKYRQKGQAKLLPNVHLWTHPDLRSSHPIDVNIPAHPTMSQQSVTTTVSHSHNFFRLEPELLPDFKPTLTSSVPARPHKLFVTLNGARVPMREGIPNPNTMQNGNVNPAKSTSGPKYDLKLTPGVNRLEVECVTTAASGRNPEMKNNNALEMEKVSIFLHLLRS